MESRKNILIALYDASSDMSLYSDAGLAGNARTLGLALGKAGLGVIARIGSPALTTILSAVGDAGKTAIALSPASSEIEHEKAFRLPKSAVPSIYTGRGALGADVCALASSHAVIIIGTEPEALEGILGCIGEQYSFPIGILSTESEAKVREVIAVRYPKLIPHILIASDGARLVSQISGELRKRQMNIKHSN
jgi:hypothetical protein